MSLAHSQPTAVFSLEVIEYWKNDVNLSQRSNERNHLFLSVMASKKALVNTDNG